MGEGMVRVVRRRQHLVEKRFERIRLTMIMPYSLRGIEE